MVALLFQQWNVEQLCKLVDHEKWSEPIHKYQFQTLVDSSAARDRVRLLCLQNSYSGAWLNICPSAAAGLRLGNPEFNIMCRFRLGCDILPQFARNCALCGAASDVFGDHLLCCQQNGIVRRHNAIVDQLARVTKAAGLPYTVDRAIDVDHRTTAWRPYTASVAGS